MIQIFMNLLIVYTVLRGNAWLRTEVELMHPRFNHATSYEKWKFKYGRVSWLDPIYKLCLYIEQPSTTLI